MQMEMKSNRVEGMSPKEQFDATMEKAKTDSMKAKGIDPEEQQLVDDLAEAAEKELDKTVGETKVSNVTEVTSEEYFRRKAVTDQRKLIRALTHASTHELTKNQKATLDLVLAQAEAEKLEDPVLRHLVKERGNAVAEYNNAVQSIKELERKLLEDISKSTNSMVKAKGVLEAMNKQILSVCEEQAI